MNDLKPRKIGKCAIWFLYDFGSRLIDQSHLILEPKSLNTSIFKKLASSIFCSFPNFFNEQNDRPHNFIVCELKNRKNCDATVDS